MKQLIFCNSLVCYERKKMPEFWLESQNFYDFFLNHKISTYRYFLETFPVQIKHASEICGIMNFSSSVCSNKRVEEKITISFWSISHTVIRHAFCRRESIFWPQMFLSFPVDYFSLLWESTKQFCKGQQRKDCMILCILCVWQWSYLMWGQEGKKSLTGRKWRLTWLRNAFLHI